MTPFAADRGRKATIRASSKPFADAATGLGMAGRESRRRSLQPRLALTCSRSRRPKAKAQGALALIEGAPGRA